MISDFKTGFCCPVCREHLIKTEKIYRCNNNHCFDESKFGYVNLLQNNQSSKKRHGDDKLQIKARRGFLSCGYYSFLKDELVKIFSKHTDRGCLALDAGCGECYYSGEIKKEISNIDFVGIDISKYALEYAGKRKVGFPLAVASLFDLPCSDDCFDAVLNVFAPMASEEFLRVLKANGILICVFPQKEHLFELKAAVYENPIYNDEIREGIDGFTLKEKVKISKKSEIIGNDNIINLFNMTPYCYKTGVTDRAKLDIIQSLSVTFAFEIRVYQKDI